MNGTRSSGECATENSTASPRGRRGHRGRSASEPARDNPRVKPGTWRLRGPQARARAYPRLPVTGRRRPCRLAVPGAGACSVFWGTQTIPQSPGKRGTPSPFHPLARGRINRSRGEPPSSALRAPAPAFGQDLVMVTAVMATSSLGTPPPAPAKVQVVPDLATFWRTSSPAVIVPNGVYDGGSDVSWKTRKNWLPLVSGPALAIATVPAG